jgi:hypothetical protein
LWRIINYPKSPLSIDNPPFAEDRKGVDELCSNLIGSGNLKIKDDFNEVFVV